MRNRIKYVRRIQLVRDTSEPELLGIKAQGLAEIKMPVSAVLVPRKYSSAPPDGIYELDFKFEDSTEDITNVELEVEVVIRIRNLPSWVKGVKINADENSDIELL